MAQVTERTPEWDAFEREAQAAGHFVRRARTQDQVREWGGAYAAFDDRGSHQPRQLLHACDTIDGLARFLCLQA